MRLYIAEKPSMGNEIAKCLKGPLKKHDGYLETADGIVTWAFGHILRQAEPNEYNTKYKIWKAQDLPIIPEKWQMIIDAACQKQFNIIKSLIEKADEIVHAGDPDREGQLLIDEILDYVNNKKPVKRILLNALDEKSIKKANASLHNNTDFLPLKKSALARARADWLIGMNLSRAYTLAARRAGHSRLVLPVGRVKTPTLALVVRRERELADFKPVDYYTLKAQFEHQNGDFWGTWKAKDMQPGLDHEGRLVDAVVAKNLLDKFAKTDKKAFVSTYSKTEKKEGQCLPFSLSALQVLAGKRFGYEPQQVLDTVQNLYERKLTTYPRSDCEYLPLNQFADAKTILHNLQLCGEKRLQEWAGNADTKIKSKAWNDKKISAHHAIIPTQVKVKFTSLTDVEKNIYFLLAQCYIAQFYPLHIYEQTKLSVNFSDEIFQTTGRVEKQHGWKILYTAENKNGNDEKDDEKISLPAMRKNDIVTYLKGISEKKATKPPVRFTPSTLLAGMKEIHKYVKNEATKKKLRAIYGIGTEATRASIIDDLIKRKFLSAHGKKKYLIPTPSAYMLVDVLPDELLYPDFTAVWEEYLNSMAKGEGTLEEFLIRQEKFTSLLCQKAYDVIMPVEGKYVCPQCKKGILVKRNGKNGAFWGCSNYPRCHMTCNDKNNEPDFTAHETRQKKAISTGMISAQDLILREKEITVQKGNSQDKIYLCPHCKEGKLRRIRGKNGYFWGCSNYPHCTANFDDINKKPALGN
ncbi:DNA topoisomerase 3 [Pectinatus cerevisiiphilus]|uniref:DNA topoisomerase n=1 Tax=Pectinatus cerevisiiphilus TaxID=86956 RepID=A0A4R3K9K0_9FIRM|nr:DNA topoisomerase 3 [Pectinatus cerevisiiphilus]TCS79716.1 DNA topoisomerase-3 [Pectinatus cerevisiiphilus]